MAEFKTFSNQTIWDIAIQLYGDASQAVRIVKDNPTLGITKLVPAGTTITYDVEEGNDIVNFFKNKETDVNTGLNNPLSGSGFDSGFKINGFN